MIREYATLKKLQNGEVIDLDGLKLKMVEGKLQTGDLYVAERNVGPQLLTVRCINVDSGYVIPTAGEYAYDLCECVKVEEVGDLK